MAAGKSMKLEIQSILLDLNDDEFERFKWTLRNLNDQNVITKSELEKATRERTVDVLVDRYPSKYCDITRTVLKKCGHNDLANRLLNCECFVGTEGSGSGSGVFCVLFKQTLLSTSQCCPRVAQVRQFNRPNL